MVIFHWIGHEMIICAERPEAGEEDATPREGITTTSFHVDPIRDGGVICSIYMEN